MTNEQKYKGPEERNKAYAEFCSKHICNDKCPCYRGGVACRFLWLALEAEEKKPLACPFCGGAAKADRGSFNFYYVFCKHCETATKYFDTKADAIAAWNRRLK